MSKTMAEVLAEHWSASTHTDRKPSVDKCDGCGEVIHTWGEPISDKLAAHQAAALSAAGFGLVADTKAEALLTMADRLEKARDMTWNGTMRKVNGWASAADFIRQHAEQVAAS